MKLTSRPLTEKERVAVSSPVLRHPKGRKAYQLAQSVAEKLFVEPDDRSSWVERSLGLDQYGLLYHPVYLRGNSRSNPGFDHTVLQHMTGDFGLLGELCR